MTKQSTIQDVLYGLAAKLDPYDQADLLTSVAALQLLPENADRTLRLETLAHAVATLTSSSKYPKVSRHRLGQLCNSPPLGKGYLAAQEDPCANLFTEAMTFFGGSYLVFPGNAEESTYVTRRLANAIFQDPDPPASIEFTRLAFEAFSTILTLSNAVAVQAGLRRGGEPVARPGGDVVIPPMDRMEALRRSVTYPRDELNRLLQQRNLVSSSLDPFIIALGSARLEEIDLENGPLSTRPLVRAGADVVVAAPGLLLPALRHRIIHLAKEFGVVDQLASKFGDAAWRNATQSLRYLGHYRVGVALPQQSGTRCYHDGFFAIDSDKLLYVQLVSDDLEDYSDQVFSSWDSKHLVQSLEERAGLAEQHAFSLPDPPNEVLMLFLVASPGRSFVLGLGSPAPPAESLRLAMTAADLETIALLEGGDPLTLWKYARASDRVRQRTRIFAFSQLDEYHLFRSRGYSYYLSDDGRPDGISISPGGGGNLRREAYRERDWHGAPSHRRGFHVEVTCLHDDPEIPLYISLSDIGREVALLVEGLPFPIWIVGPGDDGNGDGASHSLYAELVETIGYWMWQFTPALEAVLRRLRGQDVLIFRLTLAEPEEWSRAAAGPADGGPRDRQGPAVTFSVDAEEASVHLTLHPRLLDLMNSADNAGERVLMASVLDSIREFSAQAGFDVARLLSGERVTDILDRHAPLGMKKKLLLLNTALNPELDPEGLPPFRKVQSAGENELLDELGEYLAGEVGLKEGPIPDDARTAVLNTAAEFLYHQLEALVATLNAEELLEWLIEHAESITRHVAFRRLTIPTRLACFGTEERMVEQLSQELPEANKAANACRFLIEYVSACPPNGIRAMSLSVYDRLMALASGIFNFGYDSDLIHFGIADTKLRMLGSGRLGALREAFLQARESFLGAYSGAEMRHASSVFAGYWRRMVNRQEEEEPPEITRAQEAFRAEFGFTLGEFVSLLSEIMELGQEQTGAVVKAMPLSEMVDSLSQRLGWKPESVSHALSQLVLRARASFLEPEAPFKRHDVYPWRFNRALSYIRRPLVLRNADGDPRVLWGNRHVRASGLYMIDLYRTGRLKAESNEMQRAISGARNEEAEAFNDLVADLFGRDSRLTVRRRVRKIGKVRLGAPDRDLGDIDVLAAHPARHRILLVECKDLAVARTPQELANELETLFRGTGSQQSVVARHQRRGAWIQEHLDDVLEFLALPRGKRWEVETIVVVDEEMFSPHLFKSLIPVLSCHTLREEFLPGWIGKRHRER